MTTPTPGTETAANGSTANGGEAAKTADTTSSDTTSPATADQAEPCTDCLPRSPKDDRPFTGCGCNACDTESIEIHCQSEGDKARAKYAEDHQDAPSPKSYEQARLAYGQSRYKVKPILDGLNGKLADSMQEIRCRIDDRDKVDCLERSWKRVYRRLRKCRVWGCCVEEASFEVDLDESGVEHLKAQIAKFAYVTSQADECFTRLTMEPSLLEARVAAAAEQVNSIYYTLHPDKAPTPPTTTTTTTKASAAEGADAPGGVGNGSTAAGDTAKDAASEMSGAPPATEPTDYIRLYALGLVAHWHLDDVWAGYRDVDAFVSCICLAMKVSMAGHRAIAALYGELRVREARWEERNACCRRLKDHSVDEIIEGYVRCLQDDEECGDDDDDNDGGDGGGDDGYGGDGGGDDGYGGDGGGDDGYGGDGDDNDDDDNDDDDDDAPGVSDRNRHRGEESRSRRGERGRSGDKDHLERGRAGSRDRGSSSESRRARPTRR